MMLKIVLVAAAFGLAGTALANEPNMTPRMDKEARNKPCSGKKGGVSHCNNGKFVCKDGSVSASKRTCSREG